MPSDATNSLLPEGFLETFVEAWAKMRNYPTTAVHGYPAALRSDTKDWEYFTLDPSTQIFESLAMIVQQSPAQMVTVLTNDGDSYRELAKLNGLRKTLQEALMTMEFGNEKIQTVERDGFISEITHQDGCSVVKVTNDGKLAASGQAGIRNGVAVFDRIATEPEMRRRGLGMLVMSKLIEDATIRGASSGMLIATREGQYLYERLGWTKNFDVLGFKVALEK